MDFGLAGELTPNGLYHSSPGQVCGTVAYMAPEQAAGEAVSPASDWYAFGVVLYESLAARLPFAGSVGDVLRDKQRHDPPPPSRFRPEVPADLERLCVDLLHRDPARRPGGAEILRRLGTSPTSGQPPRAGPPARRQRLVGRDDHLRRLEEAFSTVTQGAAVCVRVHGPSGSGKSALARAFLDRLTTDGAVALAGRCFEQELVPFKAFDGVVDALSQHLAGLPAAEVMAVLPRDVAALVRLFPVLGRVPAVAAAPPGRGEVPDACEARRRGVGALRELFARLGDRRPLVVFVDDLQWGDADSAFLLEEMLRPPDPPALMVLLCYRSEDAGCPVLQAIDRITPVPPALAVADVAVEPLSGSDARVLAEHLLKTLPDPGARMAELIAHEAGGNPFYIGELAEAARVGLTVGGGQSLDELLWQRVRGLPSDTRRLLEVVAVAGRPVRSDVARQAAGVGAEFHASQAVLRAGRLLRGTGSAGADLAAPYHDRVGEAVLANLPPEDRQGHHLALARAAEGAGEAVLRGVVTAVGLGFPETPFRAVLGLLLGRLRLWLRGIGFRPRPSTSVPAADLRRIDVCWSAMTGFSRTDFIRGAYFQTRGLLLALRAGEPGRAARALALHGAHAMAAGSGADRSALAMIEAAAELAAGSSEQYPRTVVTLARGVQDFLAGRFRRASESLRTAEQQFRASCTGVTWELDTARTWRLWCLCHLGEWAELAADWPAVRRDAQGRSDLHAEANMGTFIMATVRTAADEPERAWADLRDVMSRWSQRGFHVQHHVELSATAIICLYQGDGPAAWESLREREPLYRRSMLWRIQYIRSDVQQLRARSALAAAAQAADPGPLLRSAERDVRSLERESAAWGPAVGCLIRACVADARHGAQGPELFAAAAKLLQVAELGAFAAAARYRQGERTAGEEGRRLRETAIAWLAGQGVRNPLRIICSHAPTPRSG